MIRQELFMFDVDQKAEVTNIIANYFEIYANAKYRKT